MPRLDEISSSRDECVAAFRDFYTFLTKLYLKKSAVLEPPKEGWPSITIEIMQGLGKTEKVISLLRHLHYLRRQCDNKDAQALPGCYFADWQWNARALSEGGTDAEELKVLSEGLVEYIPPHVIGLTFGGRNNPVFFLDTELGIIYWPKCPGEIRYNPSQELIEDDAYDYAPENEADWRGDAPAWAIADFFEVIKKEFRDMNFIPISSRTVLGIYIKPFPGSEGMIPMLQDIYREHGWPDIERYRKLECLEAVQTALEENFPREADSRDDE